MAVNLSAKQFKDENLSQIVLSALHDTGLDPRLLELELTEGTLMDDAKATLATLEQLRGIGVYLSIDDFGTGYSSMNYLKRFDVRALKIDRSFISGLPQDSENAAITRAIIAMAHGLKMVVVAEGVETGEQLVLLEEYGCDLVQGFYPRPARAGGVRSPGCCSRCGCRREASRLRHERQRMLRRPRQQRRRPPLHPILMPAQEPRRQRMPALPARHVEQSLSSRPGDTVSRSDCPNFGPATRGMLASPGSWSGGAPASA
jgi:EAL domain-containing protein (putative c-di-GMP-specific phosphodiesterase class I)